MGDFVTKDVVELLQEAAAYAPTARVMVEMEAMVEIQRLRAGLSQLRSRLVQVNEGSEMGGIDSEMIASIDCLLGTVVERESKS